jgi:glycosyltransferase involved in cell wall biosynthesis
MNHIACHNQEVKRRHQRTILEEIKARTNLERQLPFPLENEVLVSVVIITYNHEQFIRECLQSVVDQITNFPFEVIVLDDDSMDNTTAIIQEFCKIYPFIRLYVGSRGNNISDLGKATGRYNCLVGHQLALGKYIAWLDGDDYWTFESKLQKQFEALESNPDWSMCFTLGQMLWPDQSLTPTWNPTQSTFDAFDCFSKLSNRELASSRMYRANLFKRELPEWFLQHPSDSTTDLWCAINGVIGWIPQKTTIYRIHGNSGYQGEGENYKSQLSQLRLMLLLQHGEWETWLPQKQMRQQFKHYISGITQGYPEEYFGKVTYLKIIRFGAYRLLTLWSRLELTCYYVVKMLICKVKPFRKSQSQKLVYNQQ